MHVHADSDGCDFWLTPHRWGARSQTETGTDAVGVPINPPTDIANDPVNSDAMRNTVQAMMLLAAVPTNKSALLKLPSSQMALALATWDRTVTYAPGQRVTHIWNDGAKPYPNVSEPPRSFVCTKSYVLDPDPDATSAKYEPGVGTEWASYWQETYSTLLDPWARPIIFVPATGMTLQPYDGHQPAAGTPIVTSYGVKPYDPTNWPITGAQPFFASAGPDGTFTAGKFPVPSPEDDDNVYSFQN
jgi:hypothetical protein